MNQQQVKLIWSTPEAENIISYCARVSSPKNQENYDTAPKLLAYCIKHNHWSIFEMANICMEITTSRDISAQILRHKSFSFQEFSQRYAEVDGYIEKEARRQDAKNRQNSIDDLDSKTKEWFKTTQKIIWEISHKSYETALNLGVAKECARSMLPLNTSTKIYMNGSIRSWITYCLVRCEKSTQLEHREIANECWKILRREVPNVTEAVENIHEYMKEI